MADPGRYGPFLSSDSSLPAKTPVVLALNFRCLYHFHSTKRSGLPGVSFFGGVRGYSICVRHTDSIRHADRQCRVDTSYLSREKNIIIMAILVIGNIPVMYFLNKIWYNTLMHAAIGQIVLAVCAAAIFISMQPYGAGSR